MAEGVRLKHGDVMEIEMAGFGRALRHPIRIERSKPQFFVIKPV